MAQGAAPQAVGGVGPDPNFEGKTVFLPKNCTVLCISVGPRPPMSSWAGNLGKHFLRVLGLMSYSLMIILVESP